MTDPQFINLLHAMIEDIASILLKWDYKLSNCGSQNNEINRQREKKIDPCQCS